MDVKVGRKSRQPRSPFAFVFLQIWFEAVVNSASQSVEAVNSECRTQAIRMNYLVE
jgi:hypothetical protein